METIIRKKALYVAFAKPHATSQHYRVVGQLLNKNQLLSEAEIHGFSGSNGNLFFDLPEEIPKGLYTITVQLLDDNNKIIDRVSNTFDRNEFQSIYTKTSHSEAILPKMIEPVSENPLPYALSPADNERGYVVFHKSPLTYVYAGDRPGKDEIIRELSANVVKNEYENIPFSIYAARDLGNVDVRIEWTEHNDSRFSNASISVSHIECVEEQRGAPEDSYRMIPALIVPGSRIELEKKRTGRYCLTLHIPTGTPPGISTGTIIISTENGPETRLPLNIKVNDVTLEDIPNVAYFMLMTYEFTELVNNWNDDKKKQIYAQALKVLEDYKAHGMTALCPHSPFIPITDSDGNVDLTDIKAALIAARDTGLKGPVIWYMGHLIQTSKPKHPGSIMGFEPQRSYSVLEKLVREMDQFARNNHCPQLVFLPIDEPDDKSQDFHGKRFDITSPLLERIKSYGGMAAVTAVSYDTFKPKDFFLTSRYSEKELQKSREDGCAYIEYNNQVTTQCTNPAYARYIYGYHTWQDGLDGMCSWTFQNTQNSNGNPRLADTAGKDIYLAYPDPKGPLATLVWEAIRDGIEDYKLIHQLEKRMKTLLDGGHSVAKYKDLLNRIRQKTTAPDCLESTGKEWRSEAFSQTKDDIIGLILEADALTRQ